MKLKYYLRGLGIGVVVTSLLMGYSGQSNAAEVATNAANDIVQEEETSEQSLTLRQKQEAVQQQTNVEMITEVMTETENETIQMPTMDSNGQESQEEETAKENSETEQSTADRADKSVSDAANAFVKKMVNEQSSLESNIASEMDETEKTAEKTETVNITINKGEGSDTVARKLEKAGLIDSASEFDAYLMQHGYDKKITGGDHAVTTGSTWMDIAKQLTK